MGGTEEMIKDWTATQAEKPAQEAGTEAVTGSTATNPSNNDGAETAEQGA